MPSGTNETLDKSLDPEALEKELKSSFANELTNS